MKKIVIAALVMMLVCSASVFAIYSNSSIKDYTGLAVGGSYVKEKYDVQLFGGKVTEVDKAAQLNIAVSDFIFMGESNIGFYFDFGTLINLKTSYVRDGKKLSDDESKSPLYGDLTMGIVYKNELGSKITIFGAIGPQFTYFSRQNKYWAESDHEWHLVERTYMTMGIGANLEVMYKVARDVYISVGGKASVYFLKWMTKEDTSWNYWHEHHSTESTDSDNYFGYRLTPKIAVYYVF
ncbi:MAG: hypothetical protein LIR25_00040 [bacterium]|jgi:hypothetical protein|nr:hypothetical protein [Spirochaetales bacterium]MDT3388975.1 hypothetical protein [bacterium]